MTLLVFAGLWVAIGIFTVVAVIVMSVDDLNKIKPTDIIRLFLLVPLGPVLALLVLFWMIDERTSR